jgi:hypothetical protein
MIRKPIGNWQKYNRQLAIDNCQDCNNPGSPAINGHCLLPIVCCLVE